MGHVPSGWPRRTIVRCPSGRIGRAHRCARPSSEPDLPVSAHPAQASPGGCLAGCSAVPLLVWQWTCMRRGSAVSGVPWSHMTSIVLRVVAAAERPRRERRPRLSAMMLALRMRQSALRPAPALPHKWRPAESRESSGPRPTRPREHRRARNPWRSVALAPSAAAAYFRARAEVPSIAASMRHPRRPACLSAPGALVTAGG
jgi:hypothetical protein